MNPGVVVAGGGGGSGGDGGGDGSGGNGNAGANGQNGGDNAGGDGKNAGGCGAGGAGGCTNCHHNPTHGDPVDVVTGEVFTVPERDLYLAGPIALDFRRMYSSKRRGRDAGIGYGWSHTFSWELEDIGPAIICRNGFGVVVEFKKIAKVGEHTAAKGWILYRESWGYRLDANDDFWHAFSPIDDAQKNYRLTAVESPNKHRIALVWDDGKLVEVTDSAGRVIRFTQTREGRVASIHVTDPTTNAVTTFAALSYDDRGNLVAARHADGETARYQYDDDHALTTYERPGGLTFHYVYDGKHRCVETWGDYPGQTDPALADDVPKVLADGTTKAKGVLHCKFRYGQNGYSEAIDSIRTLRFFANSDGQVSKAVGCGAVTTRTFDQYGNVATHTNALGAVTTYEWDWRGRLLMETDPTGRTMTIVRDDSGRVVENVDAAGGVVKCTRDWRGNPTTIVDQRGAVTTYNIDDRGFITDMILPTGGRVEYKTDAHGNMTEMKEANGALWRWKYDYFGRPVVRTDPSGTLTQYSYSVGGKLLSTQDRAGRVYSWQYDAAGRVAAATQPDGRTMRYFYGGSNYLWRRELPDGSEVKTFYNREGWLTKIVNELGELHSNVHDQRGNTVLQKTFDGRSLGAGFDLMNRLAWTKDASGKTLYGRDLAGRLIELTFPDDTTDAVEYDARGEIIGVTGEAASVALERDAVGNVIRETLTVAGQAHAISSAFDLASARTRVESSLGHTQQITRDAAGRSAKVLLDGTFAVELTRDLFGFPVRTALPGGAAIEDEYDVMNRLTRRRVVSGSAYVPVAPNEPEWIGGRRGNASVDKAFQYSLTDDISSSWDIRHGSTQYGYDIRSRLVSKTPERAPAEVFRQDPICNLYEPGADRVYAAGGRLIQRGDTKYVWDDAGRLVEKRRQDRNTGTEEVWAYAWNGKGLLESVVRPAGDKVTFTYDPFFRRVEKRLLDPGGAVLRSTMFVWDGDTILHELRKGQDGAVEERRYCYDDGFLQPWAQRRARARDAERTQDDWLYYVGDAIDTPEELIRGDGTVAARIDRTSWGKARPLAESTADTPLRFEGQYEDEETGLAYNRFRYYDAEIGRYISPDPVGLEGGTNPYVYCPNPITNVDPYGLQYWPHPCTAGLTDGNGNSFSPPNQVSPGPGQPSAGPGFYSGYGSNGANGQWPGRTEGTNSPQQWRDQHGNGETTNGGVSRQQCHTERKAMRWADQQALPPPQGSGANLQGGNLNLGGQRPPCPNCHAAMQSWAQSRGCTVNYSHPTGQSVTYHGTGGTPTHHPP